MIATFKTLFLGRFIKDYYVWDIESAISGKGEFFLRNEIYFEEMFEKLVVRCELGEMRHELFHETMSENTYL